MLSSLLPASPAKRVLAKPGVGNGSFLKEGKKEGKEEDGLEGDWAQQRAIMSQTRLIPTKTAAAEAASLPQINERHSPGLSEQYFSTASNYYYYFLLP